MNANQLKLIRTMQQLQPKVPHLYKNPHGWNLIYGFGSSRGACSANYVQDKDIDELISKGFINEKKMLTDYGKQIR